MKIRFFLLLLILSFNTSAQVKPFALIELFTSEGNRDCPPADDVIRKISAETKKAGQNVFFLSYHVDYWNKLGWKDPFSKFQYTIRQENYSRVLAEKEMYTPEIVVNGSRSFTGSKEAMLRTSISEALSEPAKVDVKILSDSIANDTLFISYKISIANPNYVLRAAVTQSNLSSTVTKGENSGKTLNHDHVVRALTSVDKPELQGIVALPLKGIKPNPTMELIVFVQHKQTMRVYGVDGGKLAGSK